MGKQCGEKWQQPCLVREAAAARGTWSRTRSGRWTSGWQPRRPRLAYSGATAGGGGSRGAIHDDVLDVARRLRPTRPAARARSLGRMAPAPTSSSPVPSAPVCSAAPTTSSTGAAHAPGCVIERVEFQSSPRAVQANQFEAGASGEVRGRGGRFGALRLL